MEMPELNEDILADTNAEMMNQAEDSGSLDESVLQAEGTMSENIDASDEKTEDAQVGDKLSEQQEGEDTLDEMSLSKAEDESSEQAREAGNELGQMDEDKLIDNEPAKKKPKLDETDKILGADQMDEQQQIQPELEPEAEPQPQNEEDPEVQGNNHEQQELMDIDKSAQEAVKVALNKEGEKQAPGPDTDMLATLASAALEQDPKEKNVTEKTGAATPKSPIIKAESETPKKKQEMWCNVGVFDTNTTIVSDYLATPETNEHVDLVTATLGGRRIQLEPGTAYKFRVCAVNGCGTGPWSDVAAFKTTLPGFPGAPSAIKISKSPEGAHLTWEPPGDKSSEILEYAVYLAVRSASQGCQPVTTNQAQLAFVRVFCGPTNKCTVGNNSLQAAHIDTTTKPAIIFRIAARNSKGYGPATQVRWLQDSPNGTAQGVKRAVKS